MHAGFDRVIKFSTEDLLNTVAASSHFLLHVTVQHAGSGRFARPRIVTGSYYPRMRRDERRRTSRRRREGVHPALAFMSTGMSHNNWRAGASSLRMRLDYIRACSRSSMRDLTSQRTLVHAAAFAAIFRSSNLRGSKVQVVSRSCRYSHCRMARADTVIGVLAPARQKCHAFTH